MSHALKLLGCKPEPLMSYLKALGIFRLVAEQQDQQARAWWGNDVFTLRSTLNKDALVHFLLEQYKPTPIVSPWNGGSGFYPKDNSRAMDAILELESPRFEQWTEVVSIGRRIVSAGEDVSDKKRRKEWTLARCRAEFPDEALDWPDAAYVLTGGGAKFPPLLGTGGNDGRLEFSNNFMQNVVSALNLDERRNGEEVVRKQIAAALFDEGSPELVKKRSTGFYNPGGVGGANATAGFNDDSLTNPWDYVLMFEGALLFAGAAARRLSSQASSKAVFPFTVINSAAGYGTSADSEYGDSSRAEFWAPLWDRPASLRELNHIVSEGRAQMGRRQGANGADFARAVAGLGTERGVTQFQRYGFMMRNGLAYLAAPLGRFHTPEDSGAAKRVRLADVLFDLDGWLDSLRRNASGSRAPAGLGTALRQVEAAIIEFCQRGEPRDLQDVLIAVGRAERWLASSGLRKSVRPLATLSRDWVSLADNKSGEFRLARAMASILSEPSPVKPTVGPIRENLEPVDTGRGTSWKDDSTSFVWIAGDPLRNMLAVLERRCLDGRIQGLEDKYLPPIDGACSARLKDIVAFLDGAVDVQRVVDLALPLSFVRYGRRPEGANAQQRKPFDLPAAYAAMKLTLLPGKFVCPEFGADVSIATEPSMLAMLRSGRVEQAYEVASRRLKAAGLRPLMDDPGVRDRSDRGRRLAAALLFPLSNSTYRALSESALRKPDRLDGDQATQ